MPRHSTKGAPEWRGQVGFFNGRRWFEYPVIGVFAHQHHVAAARAVAKAKRELRKGTRVEQLKITLHRFKGVDVSVLETGDRQGPWGQRVRPLRA